MKGRVMFWFTFDQRRNLGTVLFRLFGQRCQNCSPKAFEHAMWYPEEVVKVRFRIIGKTIAFFIQAALNDAADR